jgi:hypothetical protein
MGRPHHSRADVHRRNHYPLSAEPLDGEYGADDVDDRVERSDLMKVYPLDRHLVYRCLGFREALEQLPGTCAGARRQSRALDESENLRHAPMRVRMRRRRAGSVVDVRPRFLPLTTSVGVPIPAAVGLVATSMSTTLYELELRRRHAGSEHARGGQLVVIDAEAAERATEVVERQPGVEQSTEDHVARGTVETVEVQQLHVHAAAAGRDRKSFILPDAVASPSATPGRESQLSIVAEAVEARFGEHQVVEDLDAHDDSGLDHASRDQHVLTAGRRIAGGVIVEQHDGSGYLE